MGMRILAETSDYIAVHKPAGMASETRNIREMDLLHTLLNRMGNKNGQKPYLAMIHRLDQPVEGIVLFAKHKKAAAVLSDQLQKQQMEKIYLALVSVSDPAQMQALVEMMESEETRKLTDYLFFDRKTNVSMVVDAGKADAKKAELLYSCPECDPEKGTALIRVQLLSGRHHQIRLQLSHAGMPIQGDRKYGGSGNCRFPALCAAELTFRDPTSGKKMTIRTAPANPAYTGYHFPFAQ